MTNNLRSYSINEENAVQNATISANHLLNIALTRSYTLLSYSNLNDLLHSHYLLQNEKGALELLKDEQKMPFDSFIELVMKPSYALAAISIWAYNKGHEFFKNTENLKMFS